MCVENERVWIVFNGEIYNYIELREELQKLGHVFHSGSDTEVILHAWQAWGEVCLHRFNGDWAFAILDLRIPNKATMFLARDRWGVKPLFYADSPTAFWFASEAKALLGTAVPFAPREQAVMDFLSGGALPRAEGSDTFFEGVQMLPPGEAIHVSAEGVKRHRWYDLRRNAPAHIEVTEEEALQELSAQVTNAVRLRLRADVPVGSCLSGGVDSTSIVGTMRGMLQEHASRDEAAHSRVNTFSAIYNAKGAFNEVDWIKQAVEFSGSEPHYTRPDDKPLDDVFDRLVWHQDEPFQTASIFAQWCVMECARTGGVTVLLDGQAADELFGGYQPGTYQAQFLEWLALGRYSQLRREWVARKRATGMSWFGAAREFYWILLHGAFAGTKPPPKLGALDAYYRRLAFNEECVGKLAPPPDQAANKLKDEIAALKATLAEDEAKQRKLEAQLAKKPGDSEVFAHLKKKKLKIISMRQRMSRRRARLAAVKPGLFSFTRQGADALHPDAFRIEEEIVTLSAKLAEEEAKIPKLHAKLAKAADKAEATAQLEKKNAQIQSLQERINKRRGWLAEMKPEKSASLGFSGWLPYLKRVFPGLNTIWNHLRGTPAMNFREYLLTQTLTTSLPHLLRFEDRNSMAFSVEARVPFTDHHLVEWAFSRGNDYKIHRGWAKWVLREAMKGRAPENILWRRDKIGFETPDATLSQNLLKTREDRLLTCELLEKYLDRDRMKVVLQRLKKGRSTREEARLVWRWLVMESWHRQFMASGNIPA
jgi:asparagine synthase (glutamine-hydrolysing)